MVSSPWSTVSQDIPESMHLMIKTNKPKKRKQQKQQLDTGYPLFVRKDCWSSISTEGIGIIMHHACVIVRCTKRVYSIPSVFIKVVRHTSGNKTEFNKNFYLIKWTNYLLILLVFS